MTTRPLSCLLIIACAQLCLPAGRGQEQRPGEPLKRDESAPGVSLQTQGEQRTIRFPHLGIEVFETKVVDPQTGEITGTATLPDGSLADVSALRAQDVAIRRSNPVLKIQPDLMDVMSASPTLRVPVVLWLDFDGDVLDAFINEMVERAASLDDPKAAGRIEEEGTVFVMAQNEATTAPVVAIVNGLDIPVRYVSTTVPAIFVDANALEILALSELTQVDTLYLEKAEEHDHNTIANSTHRTTTPYSLGYRGAGIRVAMLEDNGLDPACPYLSVSGWYFNWLGITFPDNHIHGTSGCVASRLGSRRGAAPNVSLFSAKAFSYSDSNVTSAADWIISRNIDVTNMSFGGNYAGVLQYKDRMFDFQSRYYTDSYVASAGNSGNFVGSPGTAWNCVTVGAFNDGNTSSWGNDVMAGFSDWQNPITGCEKPNLAAVGVSLDTLGQGPTWITNGYNGTSFSAPFVTGNLAIAMSRDVDAIVSPEAAMAAMIDTSWNNIEGASRLSSRDGAGGLNGRSAFRCANANRVRYLNLYRTSFTSAGYRLYNIYLVGNDVARVAIAWSASANSGYTSTVLNADLDISVVQGYNVTTGPYMGGSLSFNNNYEIVEFTPPATGWYTIRINDYRFNGLSERVGIAWSQRLADQGY
jgi:hypothetical protein